MKNSLGLRAGEWVEVREKEAILATLDQRGQLERLPFMPEMFDFCGKRFRVFKRAHKTCDPANGMAGRRMSNAVHLEGVRCNGEAHGGCQARCLIFWKEAWLKRVDHDAVPASESQSPAGGGCTEQNVVAGTREPGGQPDSDDPVFVCQSTQIPQATQPLHWLDLRQYLEDYTSGNVRLSQLVSSAVFFLCEQIASAGAGLGSAVRAVYNMIQKMRGGPPFPIRVGRIPPGARTPAAQIGLQPGELVRIRSYQEILATINEDGRNRGMSFDPEMVPYCGHTYRVLDRVHKIINEKTGKMLHLANDCIVLEGVVCQARYSKHRRFCPRSIYAYWREIWLERIDPQRPELPG